MELSKTVKRPYKIVHYNPEWPIKYEKIKAEIETIFRNKIVVIEHVGSTGMPGMTSKGVIDICVIVDKVDAFEREKKQIQSLGYKCMTDSIRPNTLMIYKENSDKEKEVHIHVFAKNNVWETEKFIVERDYFIAHPERMQMYKELKANLAQQFPDDYPAYRDGKQEFLKETGDLARKWKLEQN